MKDRRVEIAILSLFLSATTFIGVPLNGGDKGWVYVNDAFRSFINGNFNDDNFYGLFLQALLAISTIVLYLLPIMVFGFSNQKLILYVPLIWLLLTLWYFPLMLMLCIPFLIVWVVMLLLVGGNKRKLI